MLEVSYYPGCSLEATARDYAESIAGVAGLLDVEFNELGDWNCCGATAAHSLDHRVTLNLAARNLALAERMDTEGDFLIPCSACYLNLRRVEEHVKQNDGLLNKINDALSEEGLEYEGGIRVRHFLDVVATDFEPETIEPLVNRELSGLRVAPYYGCQALRPYSTFDDPENPRSMEPLIKALGAEVHAWEVGAKCCGAALMSTKKEVALELTGNILEAARGADCIVTVCPMCQMNLEAYQSAISKARDEELEMSILYLPQLMGLAFGLPDEDLKLNLNLALTGSFRDKLEIKK